MDRPVIVLPPSLNRHRGIHEIAIGIQMADTQFGKLAGTSADRILMTLGASPGVVDGAQSRAGIMRCFVDLLVESEGVAGGFRNAIALALGTRILRERGGVKTCGSLRG